ncbi:MAG: acetamidase/formamidase family protein [Gammaproteobacteria bacterium]|nr:acetamidase/formamidase family protein [Gammaproteobacteria bacterium]MDH3362407.1 acetamidase/formamidase family protein [Gammaproteobacteria bacterium]MDH3481413.1 acetamidase/formamidase family protein [Gammaproteobacteria bacterium]
MNFGFSISLSVGLLSTFAVFANAAADIVVGDRGVSCADDPACINRLHPDIPTVANADPGERIVFVGRDAFDLTLDPDEFSSAKSMPREGIGIVHALTGPVFINGAKAGDVLAVTIEAFEPDKVGWTEAGPFGFAGDQFGTDERFIVWRINDKYAVSDALPGVRIPNASFPGVVTTLPGPALVAEVLARETQLLESGGVVLNPDPDEAEPASVCGAEGTRAAECLRTIPPREHGGNMDIRYITTGTTVYLPCFIDGCGLAVGDFHYAQGDGEVAGTAIEMGGRMTVTTRVVEDPPDLSRGPHYEGPASVLGIPSKRFYAVTGFPLKEKGSVPADLAYLDSPKIAGLSNLSSDINLAARNALAAIIDYIMSEYGYDRTQAYMIASVAVDMRIGQLVDVPNVGVTAVLPLDIFVGND